MFIEKYPNKLKYNDLFRLIQQALEKEDTFRKEAFQDILNQFFVNTATWGLYKWEEMAGIETPTDVDIETRRSNVLAALRSRDTTTKEKIRVVSESYANGECEVIEENDKYIFHIKFVGVRGIPKRIDELRKSIERIKPAHLDFDFIFTYLTWQELDNYNYTWDELDALNLTWDKLETHIKKKKGGV